METLSQYDDSEVGYYTQFRPEIARLIPGNPARILEIGCAQGMFRKNIDWNCEYVGVEPYSPAAVRAEQNGVRVLQGTYDSVKEQIPDGYFDLVVCNDVIEHMSDPWDFLGDVKRKLVAGGCLIGSVPNVRYLLNLRDVFVRKDWHYVGGGVLDRTHLRFFTPKSLQRMLVDLGWRVDFVKPSGPDRYATLKKLLSPFFWPIGTDVLYMQIAFRVFKNQLKSNGDD